MSTEKNKAILRKLHEELNKGNIDAYDESFSPDHINRFHGGSKTSAEQKDTWNRGFILRKGDIFIDEMIAEGDRVAAWMTIMKIEGKGDKNGCAIYRFSGGKIVESWNMISIQSEGKGAVLPFD